MCFFIKKPAKSDLSIHYFLPYHSKSVRIYPMAQLDIIATSSGTLPEGSNLYTSVQRLVTIVTASDGSARLRAYIGEREFNNGARLGNAPASLPAYKDYPDMVAFLQDWPTIDADPIQVRTYKESV